jgi:Domain of unknown function (DUF4396)
MPPDSPLPQRTQTRRAGGGRGATWPSWQLHPVCIIAVFTTVVPLKEITARPAMTASAAPAAAGAPPPRVPWSTAALAALHCLTGCAIGEILGMVIGTAASLPNITTVVLAVALAFVFGYALTARGLLRAGVGLSAALRAALAADTASIAVMELTDNTVIAAIPGAMDAGLGTALFWASLAFSLIVAFVATVPLNRWLIGHGKGHALLHTHHQ